MKKNLLILTLALLIALPVFGLAADATTPVVPEVQATETTTLGGQYGPRWRQTTPEGTTPQTGLVDANNDGICDNCGSEQGKNTDAPGFIDENKDGVCDHFGTNQQGRGQGLMQGMRGRMHQMMGRMQQMMGRNQQTQGRGQGMMGSGQQGQGNVQGQNYADTNNDGVCDHFGTGTQQNFGHGRNRR